MKKFAINMLSVMAIAGLLVTMAGTAAAGAKTAASKDVDKLNAEITMLNSDANLPQGDKVISKQLTDSFNVSSDKISSLLGRNMQYGDVAATLAFADKMPGGITDANINQVVNMRSKAGWDQVARSINVDIGAVASKISSLEDSAHKNIKLALAESLAGGRAAGGVSEPSGEMPGGATGGTGTTEGMPGGPSGGGGGRY